MGTPRAPGHLRRPTKAWWRSVMDEYDLQEHHERVLTAACEAWDRMQEAREAIAEHGLTYCDRFGAPRARPELAVERDSRIAFARLVRDLELDDPPDPEEVLTDQAGL